MGDNGGSSDTGPHCDQCKLGCLKQWLMDSNAYVPIDQDLGEQNQSYSITLNARTV